MSSDPTSKIGGSLSGFILRMSAIRSCNSFIEMPIPLEALKTPLGEESNKDISIKDRKSLIPIKSLIESEQKHSLPAFNLL